MNIKKRSGSGGANWMDTYGDMVTLLLCFFVMLYSMSTLDKEKWIALVQSFNPDAVVQTTVQGGTGTASDTQDQITQEEVDQDLEQLYQAMQSYVQENALTGQISISRGNGYVFVSFDDTVFFDGNSYTLLPAGQAVLDQVAQSIAPVSDSIDEIRVLGHTAQEVADRPNHVTADRFLASNRATVVTVYLQEKNVIEPTKLVSVGYGQWRPVSGNATPEERAANRRVELIVTGIQVDSEEGSSIKQYYTMRGEDDVPVTATVPPVSQQPQQEGAQ